jgi:hypothetical protein
MSTSPLQEFLSLCTFPLKLNLLLEPFYVTYVNSRYIESHVARVLALSGNFEFLRRRATILV